MTTVKEISQNNISHKLYEKMLNEFYKYLSEDLKYTKYTRTKIKEKSLQWNKKYTEMINRIEDDKLKDKIAEYCAKLMINKSLEVSGEYPYLCEDIEERFIRRSI